MSLQRREFLKVTLASGAAVSVGNGGVQLGHVLEATGEDEVVPGGTEKYVTTACTRCSGGCGVRVRLIDERAVTLEGNPRHPVTGAGVCAVAQASLQALYSPDRVRGPLRRVGKRGAGEWQAIGWEEALTTVARRLEALRAAGEPDALAILLGQREGPTPELFRRFAQAYGTPHVLESAAPDAGELALWAAQGIRAPVAYDLENAQYLVSFGVPLLDGWWSPVRQMRALAEIRQGRPGRRGKLVQLEPRLSPTAARADEWVPLVPGTEGALALGLANVLVAEGRYDRAFVAEHTFGFEDWSDEAGAHPGFRTLLLKEYSPATVARITGVPEDTISRIALEMASFGPALAIGPAGCGADLQGAVAVHALNALLGSIDRPGGALVAPAAPAAAWPAVVPDAVAQRGLAARPLGGTRPAGSAGFVALTETGVRRPKALLFWGADPAFTGPDPAGLAHALGEIPFVVSFASLLDESSAYADLVLPDHVFLEAWQEVHPSPAAPRPVVAFAQPVVKPRHDTRAAGDVLLDLTRRLGGSIPAAFPWKEYADVLKAHAAALQQATSAGAIFAAAPSAADPADAASPAAPQSFDDYWSDLLARGGWIGVPYRYGEWARVFRTPSGKFEFYSHALRDALPAARAGGDERAYLPHWTPREEPGDPASFPLRLHAFTTLALGNGASANEPYLQEIVAPHLNVAWDAWVELHPATAARFGIRDGDRVWVESPVGRAGVRAKLWQGVMPDVAAIVLGQGHRQLGRYAQGTGANAAVLLPGAPDPLTGRPRQLARVKVYTA